MTEPRIILGGTEGLHNQDLAATAQRLQRGRLYRDASTVMVVPTRGRIPARVVDSWMNLMAPMNHPFVRMFVEGMEVAHAYNQAIGTILNHPALSAFKYVLTVEEDNLPPPDGLLKLLESIDDYAAVGGLYFTKGPDGQPMIYGAPGHMPMFAPQIPKPETVQPCNGLGQGFTLFKLDLFRELPAPWFETVQRYTPGVGVEAGTQDLAFFAKVRQAGHKIACDTRVRVGHYDHDHGTVW